MDSDWLLPFTNELVIKNQPLPDEFDCPKCNFKPHYFYGNDDTIGYKIKCPQCNYKYEVESDR